MSTIKPTTIPPKVLYQSITSASTSFKLPNILGWDGVALTSSDFGSVAYGAFLSADRTQMELFQFDPSTIASSSIDFVTRGLSFTGGIVEVSANKLDWTANETTVLLGTDTPQLLKQFATLGGTNTYVGANDFTGGSISVPTPTASSHAVSKNYADNLVASGAADASTTVKGIARLSYSPSVSLGTVTMTIASPAVATLTTHGLTADDIIQFTTDGALPTGVTASTNYYIISTDLTTDTFKFSATQGGSAVNTSGSQSGIHTLYYVTPKAVATTDPKMPTQDENNAMAGTSGSPSSTNKFVTNDDTSATPSGSKAIRWSGGAYPAGNGSAITGLTAYRSIASGENLTAGQPVYVNPTDSSVYVAHGFKALDSTALNLTVSTSNKIAKLSDTQAMFLTDNGGTTLTITVYDINSAAAVATQTVTTAFDQTTVTSATRPSATVCRLTNTTFVVFYARTTDNALYFRTGSISGGSITMDTETAYPTSPTYCFGMDATPGAADGEVVFTYFDSNAEPGNAATVVSTLSYLTITTNSVTVTTTVTDSEASGSYSASPTWSCATFTRGVAYGLFSALNASNQSAIKASYININNSSTGSAIYTPNLESPVGTGVGTAYGLVMPYFVGHNGKAYFGWATTNGGAAYVNTKTILEVSRIGCKVFYQTSTVKLGGDTTVAALPMYGNENGIIAFGFKAADGTTTGGVYIQKDKVIPFYSATALSATSYVATPKPQSWYSNLKDEIVLVYLNGSSGTIKQWKIPTLFDGIVQEDVTSPDAATIYTDMATTSGLTANAEYFLKDTYTTAGDMDLNGTIKVGDALSTTVMKID